jgi:NAD+ synthase
VTKREVSFMPGRFRLTLAQLNPTVGDLAGNARMAAESWAAAKAAGADMIAFPEMFLTGYQTQDLGMKPAFVAEAMAFAERLAADCADGPAIGIGAPFAEGDRLYNAYWILEGGRVAARVLKHHLPNEDVFDERRVYASGPISGPYRIGPLRIGTPICEDAWYDDVTEALAESGAQILLVPNGSPYFRGKQDLRQSLMVARTVETGLPLVYLNHCGGQDDQVFDGASFVLNPHGRLAVQLPFLDEILAHVDFEETAEAGARSRARRRTCRTRGRPITA